MSQDSVEEIKNKLDLKDVIADYVQLQKRGVNFAVRCPFHNEKTPSFFVSPARQVWRCFGCGVGGDMFTFIEQIEGVEFSDALRLLANKAGVELKRQNPQIRNEKNKSLEINELAAQYFHRQLNSKNGDKIIQHLADRGITESSIKNFLLGYAPHNGRAVIKFLTERGYAPQEIERAGLSFALRGSGEHVSRFRGRIMFPIFNAHGDVVGFGGRILTEQLAKQLGKELPQDTGKYINTPQTHIYDKSSILYGLDKAKVSIRQHDEAIMVEGYTDVILAHQAGCDNTIAASGTALTEDQLNLLGRFSKNLLTAFDMDIAGDSATKRGIDKAQNMGYNIKVITLPADSDPADVIKDSPQVWQGQVAKAENVVEFYFNNALRRYDVNSAEGKRIIGGILAPIFANIPSRIEQAHWVQKLAERLTVDANDVWIEVRKVLSKDMPAVGDAGPTTSKPQLPRRELLAQHILLVFLQHPQLYEEFEQDVSQLSGSSAVQILQNSFEKNKKQFNISILSNDERSLLDQMALEAEVHNRFYTKQDLEQLLADYKKLSLEDELHSLEEQIRFNESEGKIEANGALLSDFQKKAEQLVQLTSSSPLADRS